MITNDITLEPKQPGSFCHLSVNNNGVFYFYFSSCKKWKVKYVLPLLKGSLLMINCKCGNFFKLIYQRYDPALPKVHNMLTLHGSHPVSCDLIQSEHKAFHNIFVISFIHDKWLSSSIAGYLKSPISATLAHCDCDRCFWDPKPTTQDHSEHRGRK